MSKLEIIKPAPFSPDVAKYLQKGVFPNIAGQADITDAGDYINAKYGHLGLTIYIWFTIGRLMCNVPPAPKAEQSIETDSTNYDDPFYDEDFDSVNPDLVLDNFDPILISYKSGAKEKWYLQITLATLNNLWCQAKWDYDIKHKTETLLDPATKHVKRLDTLSEYSIKVEIPDFWGYVRFKILDEQQKSVKHTSGCLKYQFTNFEFQATITTKLIDKRFRTKEHKWRAPDIKINYKFKDVNYEILWYPFAGDRLPADDDIKIPKLTKAKIKTIIDDVFNEKIKQNREEFIDRYVNSILEKLIPRVVKECRSKVDLVLTFATVLANGTADDIYNLPPATAKLIKLGLYSVTKRSLRDEILQMLVPQFKMPEDKNMIFEKKLQEATAALQKLRQIG